MIRRPPRSPLFPYTTLSRSVIRNLRAGNAFHQFFHGRALRRAIGRRIVNDRILLQRHLASLSRNGRSLQHNGRSEEHTSELQSRQYLVCRLLLEKKNKSITL